MGDHEGKLREGWPGLVLEGRDQNLKSAVGRVEALRQKAVNGAASPCVKLRVIELEGRDGCVGGGGIAKDFAGLRVQEVA